jgi:hypothetical protein
MKFKDTIDFDEDNNSDIKKNVTSIKQFIYDFDMDLSGHDWSGEKGKYVYNGKCLLDGETKSQLLALLKPFTNDINMITGKEASIFSKQKFRLCSLANDILTASTLGCPVENKRIVMSKFMNTIQNIGDVILESRDNIMKGMFSNKEEDPFRDRPLRID